jgi:tripartite-type tricarboxylate transporter receptor subunit TctC
MLKKIAVAAAIVISAPAFAQLDSSRPISLIVPFSAGGPTDVVARQLAKAMSTALDHTIIVENRPSAGGIIGSQVVARAAPDGYTLLIHNIGMSTAPALYRKLPFNPQNDFDYIGQIVDVPMTLVAKKTMPPNNFSELVPFLAANKDSVTLAHAGLGTASHLCGLLLTSRMKVPLTTIPYKGAAPALTDVQGGHVDMICDQTTTTSSTIKAGTVKTYGLTTKARLDSLPGVPTIAEQGWQNFEVNVWHGLYAPKGLSPAVTDELVKGLQKALANPDFTASMAALGTIVATQEKATPDGLRNQLNAEIARWSPIIHGAKQYAD